MAITNWFRATMTCMSTRAMSLRTGPEDQFNEDIRQDSWDDGRHREKWADDMVNVTGTRWILEARRYLRRSMSSNERFLANMMMIMMPEKYMTLQMVIDPSGSLRLG